MVTPSSASASEIMTHCPHCGSKRTIRAGKQRNKYVVKQAWRCKDCKRWFIERDGFEGMTYPKETIIDTLRFYAEGLSLGKIRRMIQQNHGYRIHDSRILYWVRKYASLIETLKNRSGYLSYRQQKVNPDGKNGPK